MKETQRAQWRAKDEYCFFLDVPINGARAYCHLRKRDTPMILLADRRSGSEVEGFYRPGERSEYGAPFEVLQTKPPCYSGPPSGRAPTHEEKRGAWHLQEEYLAGRLGRNDEENSRLWNTAIWVDTIIRTATMPAEAVKAMNLCADGWSDAFSPEYRDPAACADETNKGFGFTSFKVDERDKKRLAIKLSDDDLFSLVDYFKESEELATLRHQQSHP
ncbi:hypothetical protein ACVW1A_000132 [Bradyrhizobium sp. LB1.3]